MVMDHNHREETERAGITQPEDASKRATGAAIAKVRKKQSDRRRPTVSFDRSDSSSSRFTLHPPTPPLAWPWSAQKDARTEKRPAGRRRRCRLLRISRSSSSQTGVRAAKAR